MGLKLPVDVLPFTLGGLLPVILVLLSIHIAFRQKRWLTLLVLFVELGSSAYSVVVADTASLIENLKNRDLSDGIRPLIRPFMSP